MARRKARPEVLAVLADGQWHTAKNIQAITGLSGGTINSHLNDLAGRPWRELPTSSVRPVEREERRTRNPDRVSGLSPRITGIEADRGKRVGVIATHYRLRPVVAR